MVWCFYSYLVRAHTVYLQLEDLCLAQAGGVDRRTGVVGRLLQAQAAQLKLRPALTLHHLTAPEMEVTEIIWAKIYRFCQLSSPTL